MLRYIVCFGQASEVIEDLEQTVVSLKQQIQESEKKRQRQLRVSTNTLFTHVLSLKILYSIDFF